MSELELHFLEVASKNQYLCVMPSPVGEKAARSLVAERLLRYAEERAWSDGMFHYQITEKGFDYVRSLTAKPQPSQHNESE